MIPMEIQKAITSVLNQNEKILWQGSPALDAQNKPERNAWRISMVAGIIIPILIFIVQQLINNRQDGVSKPWPQILALAIITSLGAAGLNYVQQKRMIKKRGYLAGFRTEVYYAVTNQRVLYFHDRKVNQAYREKSFQELNRISLQEWSDNYKSIVFGENLKKSSIIWTNAQQDGADFPPFLDIKNAEQVYELILQQKDQALGAC